MKAINESYEFLVLRDLYDEVRDKQGLVVGTKLVKKNIKTKLRIYLADIFCVEEVANAKGVVEKKKCGLSVKEKGFMVVNEPYMNVSDMVFNHRANINHNIGFNVRRS